MEPINIVTKLKTKKAFTLIELTVSMGVLALIVGITAGVLISVVKSYQKQRVLAEIERNGDFLIRTIEESLRGANSITCVQFDGTPVPPSGDGSTTCSLGSAGNGMLLLISDGTNNKYIGNASDSGATSKAICTVQTPPSTNCYGFSLTSLGSGQLATDGTILNSSGKLTNSDSGNGVNVTKFEAKIKGGSSGVPYNVAVTIDIKGSYGSDLFKDEVRTFQSFLTLRGSYQ